MATGDAEATVAASARQDAGRLDGNGLALQATDPTACLVSLGFITTYTRNPRGCAPRRIGGPVSHGMKDVSILNLTVANQSWGRGGLGPVMTFATGNAPADRVAIRPTVGFVYQADKWLNVKLFSQDVLWKHIASSQPQPTGAFQIGDGWSLSLGDLQFMYDGKASRWLNAPIGVQMGNAVRIASQAASFALTPQRHVIDGRGFEQWKVSVSVILVLPSQ